MSGSVTIDGATQSITGACEVMVDDAIGPVGFVALGSTDDGWDIRAASQNLLIYAEYVAEKDGKRYALNTPIAQNLELPFPTAASSGTSIEGGGTLYVFTGDFLQRVEDAANPTGYEAVVFTIDAVCTP